MGFIKNYRQRRVSLTALDTVATLSAMERFFQGGSNWTRWAYHRANGSKCLVGAAQSMRQGPINDARYWLRQAIAERAPVAGMLGIEWFNDTRRSYSEVAEVLARAKQLAAQHQAPTPAPVRRLPPPAPVMEILPPEKSRCRRIGLRSTGGYDDA